MAEAPLVVLGSGLSGRYLIERLRAAGQTAQVVSRRPVGLPEGFAHIAADLFTAQSLPIPRGAIVISFLPLWVLGGCLDLFRGAEAVIATGSTSMFSKASSSTLAERKTSDKLRSGEEALKTWAEKNGVSWTVLRPTIIYDGKTDQNITRMLGFIRRWRFLPIAAPASGLRRPIHADDVAFAAFCCIGNPQARNRAFNISGSETLTYRQMASRAFEALGLQPRFLPVPVGALRWGLRVAAALGLVNESSLNTSMFERMNKDLVFDVAEGLEALDYRPRPFLLSGIEK